ncbi:MAG: hypothetical protein PHY12_00250 [Eubacteriales bacterium]|nr:hypothetical protein [Eubacteriales bacterium]
MIGIICIIDLEYIPYLTKYTDYFDSVNEQYEIIYWKRMNTESQTKYKTIPYDRSTELATPKNKKFTSFWGYSKFVNKKIRQRKYDKLVVLSTLMGGLIRGLLVNEYQNRFIFDIRDYTYERYRLFKKIEEQIISSSCFTAISSEGYLEFLPPSKKYVLCHNFLKSEIDEKRKFKKSDVLPLELTFIGAVRHFDLDKKVVDEFSKDERFKIVFHGYGASYCRLSTYCQDKPVLLTGKYDRKDKERLLNSSDIINSYYDENDIANRFALSNKFYDAAIYRKPLWANPDTYIGQLAITKGIGINCKIEPALMYKQYCDIVPEIFEESCKNVVKEIIRDDDLFLQRLRCFIEI